MINCKICLNKKNCVYAGEDREMDSCRDYIPKTNAYHIREMTDEQLSEWIADWFDCSNCSEFFGGMPCSQRECADVWLGWLKREVSDEVR